MPSPQLQDNNHALRNGHCYCNPGSPGYGPISFWENWAWVVQPDASYATLVNAYAGTGFNQIQVQKAGIYFFYANVLVLSAAADRVDVAFAVNNATLYARSMSTAESVTGFGHHSLQAVMSLAAGWNVGVILPSAGGHGSIYTGAADYWNTFGYVYLGDNP